MNKSDPHALLVGAYVLRWLERNDVAGTYALSQAEQAALLNRAHAVAARFERIYTGEQS